MVVLELEDFANIDAKYVIFFLMTFAFSLFLQSQKDRLSGMDEE